MSDKRRAVSAGVIHVKSERLSKLMSVSSHRLLPSLIMIEILHYLLPFENELVFHPSCDDFRLEKRISWLKLTFQDWQMRQMRSFPSEEVVSENHLISKKGMIQILWFFYRSGSERSPISGDERMSFFRCELYKEWVEWWWKWTNLIETKIKDHLKVVLIETVLHSDLLDVSPKCF